jgi:hypothetical protein
MSLGKAELAAIAGGAILGFGAMHFSFIGEEMRPKPSGANEANIKETKRILMFVSTRCPASGTAVQLLNQMPKEIQDHVEMVIDTPGNEHRFSQYKVERVPFYVYPNDESQNHLGPMDEVTLRQFLQQ